MGFRDDKDAMLARAEALDREVKRLETENAELRAERERAAAEAATHRAAATRAAEREAAKRQHLEALAAKAVAPRSERARPARSAKRTPKPVADPAERLRRRALRHAFTPIWLDGLLGAMIVVAWLAGFVAGGAVMAVTGFFFPPIVIPFLAAGALGSVYLHIFVRDRHAMRTARWLAALPLAIDVPAYLDRIANRFDETLVVSITVADVTDEDKPLLARAVAGAVATASTSWVDDALVVTSPRLQTCYRGSKGSRSYHNAKPHRWFVRLVERALLPIAASHRITGVRVR